MHRALFEKIGQLRIVSISLKCPVQIPKQVGIGHSIIVGDKESIVGCKNEISNAQNLSVEGEKGRKKFLILEKSMP